MSLLKLLSTAKKPRFCLRVVAVVFAMPGVGAADQVRPWMEYRTIMWIGDSAYKKTERIPLFFDRLREMGINTGMVHGDGDLRPVLDNHFPYYVENMVNRGLCLKWSSKVTDWDKFVTDWAKSGRPDSALVRDYCLDDPQWRGWARGQMQSLVRKNMGHEPLAYNIRDELSTTISANPFDYDFNPLALAAFREWLKTQYGELAALNAEWETGFTSWDQVRPFTTDQIKNRMASGEALPRGKPDWQALQEVKFDPGKAVSSRTRWNFSPWADFRTYMDLSLARTLDRLRQAAHELDPGTPVGIEGTQMPHAFGGYDLWRLSQALDWVEPYDIGNAREILGSFMPNKPILTTVFEKDTNPARRRLWHLLLEGDRGCIIWWSEDCIDWQSEDYRLTPKAEALAPVLREVTSPLARLFLRAHPERDAVYIHYSQPSIQVDWLLESTVDGSTWLRRFSSFESDHNRQAQVRDSWLKLFQDLGYSPQFVSTAQIEQGRLKDETNAVLVLPSAWALSDKEAAAIASFSRAGQNVLFSDGTPGWFDAHGKLRPTNPLPELQPAAGGAAGCRAVGGGLPAATQTGDIARYAIERLKPVPISSWLDWVGKRLVAVPPAISVAADTRVRIHRCHLANAQLVAFERNIDYHMSEELKQAGGNEALEKAIQVAARLAPARYVYDLRTERLLGHMDRIQFTVDPWQPSLFALTQREVPNGKLLQALETP